MKASAIYVFLITGTLAAVRNMDITARGLDATSICGKLEVMTVNTSELPSNATRGGVRMCAKHPQGRNRTLDTSEGASLAPAHTNEYGTGNNVSTSSMHLLTERGCYFEAPYGCSRGYCWKVCDQRTGKWCWAAKNGGYGNWRRCTTYADCGVDELNFGCGQLCGPSCGCGC